MNRIGAGLVLDNNGHTGNLGQGGEIGYTSINFSGPSIDPIAIVSYNFFNSS